jgi:hypothetical protein
VDDGIRALQRARETALAHVSAVAATAEFADRLPDAIPDAATIAEYGALLASEERTYAERRTALHTLGLQVRSLEAADAD